MTPATLNTIEPDEDYFASVQHIKAEHPVARQHFNKFVAVIQHHYAYTVNNPGSCDTACGIIKALEFAYQNRDASLDKINTSLNLLGGRSLHDTLFFYRISIGKQGANYYGGLRRADSHHSGVIHTVQGDKAKRA